MLSSTSRAQTAPVQETAPTQQAVPAQQEADAVPAVPAVSIAPPFAPGAKVFLEPMEGFEKLLAHSIAKQKVPVVFVDEREKADFVLSGEAHLKKAGWLMGSLLSFPHGKGNISVKDARTGNEVFAYTFTRVDTDKTDYQVYQAWANACAGRLKKAVKKK
jgi:hypothetical protein